MRYLRLAVGSVIVLVALYIIVAEQMSGASGNAVVNAPVVTLRTPIAGELNLSPLALGAVVERGETVADIADRRADEAQLNDLLMERDFEQAEINRLRSLRDDLEKKTAELEARAQAYREARRQELAAAARIAPPNDAGLPESNASEAADAGTRRDRLGQVAEEAPEPGDEARSRTVRQVQREAAEEDVYLDNSASPVWNHDLRLLESKQALDTVQSDLKAARARLSAYQNRIERERLHVNARAAASVSSPVTGIVWERLAASGVILQRGDPILRIANCEDTVVTMSVSENIYNTLEAGDVATVRIAGSGEVHQGTVARLAGPGAATVYREMAVAPGQKDLERFDVSLIVPALRGEQNAGCAIGRTGRVFFDDRPLDVLRRFWD